MPRKIPYQNNIESLIAEADRQKDINQPCMPRNIPLRNKIESYIAEADRHVNAVGLSVAEYRNGGRNTLSGRTYNALPTSQETPYQPPIPHIARPFHSVNSPQRQNSSFQPSWVYQFAPSQQQLSSQGSVNPARTSPLPQYTRVTEGAMYEFGAVPDPNNGTGQFGSSESGGQSLGGPVVDGRRRDTSFSESKAGPSRFQDQPPPSQWQETQQPTPLGPFLKSSHPSGNAAILIPQCLRSTVLHFVKCQTARNVCTNFVFARLWTLLCILVVAVILITKKERYRSSICLSLTSGTSLATRYQWYYGKLQFLKCYHPRRYIQLRTRRPYY